jgi:hypothetical protein
MIAITPLKIFSKEVVHEITAAAFAVVSVELQVKVFMPPIVADPEISFLRRCVYMKRDEERAAEQRDEVASSHVEHGASPPLRASAPAVTPADEQPGCAGSAYHGGWAEILGMDLNRSESRRGAALAA